MQIYVISSDSEQTLSDRVETVDHDLLQEDADSKAADCQQQETVPGRETPPENENVQDDVPLDITPISVCFERYTTHGPIVKISEKLQSMLSTTVRIVTPSDDASPVSVPCIDSNAGRIYRLQCALRALVEDYTSDAKEICNTVKNKNNLPVNAAPEAPSDHPGPSEVIAPSPEASNAIPCDQPLPDNKVAVKKKRAPCTRHERMKVEFVIPSHVDTSDLDLDNLVPSFEARPNQDPRRTREFSFAQRLREWEFEVRERDYGKYDMYYYYGELGYFRSIPEVTRFIMYEEYPGGKPLPGRNKRKSRDACQSEVLPLMPKTGKKRGRKPKNQSEVLSTVEQGSSSKPPAKRGRKRKYDQPTGNNEAATMSNLTMMLNNETSVTETLSNPEGHVAVMLRETMTRIQRFTDFTAELGNTAQVGDEAAAPSDGHPKERESGMEDID